MATWQDKAHKIIGDLCMQAWQEVNFNPKTGRQYKTHRPYHVPALAQQLVECMNMNDEEQAKAIFLKLAMYTSCTDI